MTVLDTCRCVGSLCTCNGVSVLKDGGRLRIPMMLRDGSASGEKHVISDEERAQARAEAYRDHMIEDVCRTSGGITKTGRTFVLEGEAKRVHDAALAQATAAGLSDDAARTHAAREAMIHDQANAWRRQ